jgi:uncharacterized protein (TIGR00251 family)
MIKFVNTACHLSVHATPGSRRTSVGGSHDNALRVFVTEPADKGKANQAIVRALAEALGVPRSTIQLARGATHRRKTLIISEPPKDLSQRVAELASMG